MPKKDEVLTKKVEGISHDWRVVEKKRQNKVVYYLLECQNHVGAFDVIKESLSSLEHFSGKQLTIQDKERVYKFTEIKANGRTGIKEVEKSVPYLHHLKDSGKCTSADVKQVFGKNWEPFKLINVYDRADFEFLFYDATVKKSEPKPKATTKTDSKK
jgi:hypothetical protein